MDRSSWDCTGGSDQDHPQEQKCKKTKWLSEEALQIAEKRGGKGEKESNIHLNAEFQRRARRDKKSFHSDQCKEIEENNRMGKTRDLFKNIRDTKVAVWKRYLVYRRHSINICWLREHFSLPADLEAKTDDLRRVKAAERRETQHTGRSAYHACWLPTRRTAWFLLPPLWNRSSSIPLPGVCY